MDSRYLPGWFPSRLLPALIAVSAWAAAPDGAALYKTRCAGCHDGTPQARMPSHDELAAKTPDFVFKAMFAGAMVTQSAGLTQDEGRAIARFITGKEFSASSALQMSGQCTTPAKALSVGDGDWNGWGVDSGNSHYQPKPGLAASDIPKLKLKWAFGFPKDPMAWAQPTIVGGTIVRRQRVGQRVFARCVLGLHLLDLRGGRRCANRHQYREAFFGKVGRVLRRYHAPTRMPSTPRPAGRSGK